MADSVAGISDAQKPEKRNHELSILNSMAQALNRSVELDQTLRTTLGQVAQLLGLHTGWIWLLDEETGESYLAAEQNLPPALSKNPRRMSGRCYCLDTYRSGDLSGAANISVVTCSRLRDLVDGTDGLRYHASIPLYAHGKKLGVLNVASTDWRELSADDLRILYTIGDLAGIAIERARLFTRSAKLGAVEERSRLARELHDTLAQGLAGIALQLECADALLDGEGDREQLRRIIQQALALTRANLEETRRSVQDLRAAPLEGRTLADALQVLVAQMAESVAGQPRLTFAMVGESRPLSVRLENGLYRLAQEALTNAIRHAGAAQVSVRLETTPHRIRLIVDDDGQGFDPAEVADGRYGLIGMNERTKLLGGTLRLESGPNTGSRLEVVIPLEEKR